MDKGEKSAENDKSAEIGAKIKDEPQEETIKHFAENTMNELLSIFGYEDKVNSADTEKLDFKRYALSRDQDGSDATNDELVSDDDENGEEDGSSDKLKLRLKRPLPNGTTDIELHHRNLLSVLKLKEATKSSDEQTVSEREGDPCVWCRKSGPDQYIVKTENGEKSFCSEVCFLQSRRASFKKSKICDWCKHVRHTVNYVEFQDGDSQLQFCSEKCLSQYKMSIFCKETQEHLSKIKQNGDVSDSEKEKEKEILITPDLWLTGERLANIKETNQNKDDTVGAKRDSNKKSLTNSPEKSVKKMTEPKSNSELQKQSLIERIKAEASIKQKRLQLRKETERQIPVSSATEPATSPRPGSLAQGSPQIFHPVLAGMAPWIHQAQLLGSLGQPLGPYGAYSSVIFPGLMPPYPPELMAEMAAAAERGKETSLNKDRRIKTESGVAGVQRSPHSEIPSSSSTTRRGTLLEVPSETAGRSASPNRTSVGSSARQSSSLFPVDFPQMFPGQNFPAHAPPAYQGQPPPQRMVGNNIPPVTMMIPFPVLLPLPVPIPIPIPLTMDTLQKYFQSNKQNNPELKYADYSGDKDLGTHLRDGRSSRPTAAHSPLSVSSSDELCFGNEPRSGSRNSCPDLHTTYHYVSPSLSDVSILKRSRTPDEVGTLDLSKRAKQPKIDSLSYESTNGAINLSTKYNRHSRSSAEDLSKNASSNEDDTDDKNSPRDSNDNFPEVVPKIHIVTHAETRPLNQHLPLQPVEHKYANRRRLILDAPSVPKKKRSPSPERPNYVRNIPRDLIEAARRRSLRARNTIRTK